MLVSIVISIHDVDCSHLFPLVLTNMKHMLMLVHTLMICTCVHRWRPTLCLSWIPWSLSFTLSHRHANMHIHTHTHTHTPHSHINVHTQLWVYAYTHAHTHTHTHSHTHHNYCALCDWRLLNPSGPGAPDRFLLKCWSGRLWSPWRLCQGSYCAVAHWPKPGKLLEWLSLLGGR